MPIFVATIEMPSRVAEVIALTGFCALLAGCSQEATEQSTTSSGSRVSSTSSPPTTSPIPLHAASYPTALEAGIAGVQAFNGLPYVGSACANGAGCIGTAKVFGNTAAEANAAAYVRFASGSTTECFAYVFFESGGWHYMPPSPCVPMPGNMPALGEVDHVKGTGSCANVRLEPSLSSKVVACLKDGQVVQIDQDSPRYVDKHIWWSIDGHRGWMVHDFLIYK